MMVFAMFFFYVDDFRTGNWPETRELDRECLLNFDPRKTEQDSFDFSNIWGAIDFKMFFSTLGGKKSFKNYLSLQNGLVSLH